MGKSDKRLWVSCCTYLTARGMLFGVGGPFVITIIFTKAGRNAVPLPPLLHSPSPHWTRHSAPSPVLHYPTGHTGHARVYQQQV